MTIDQASIDRLAAEIVPAGKLLINGKWLEGSDAPHDVISPINGQKLTTTASASAADVARATAAARAAFEIRRLVAHGPIWRARPCCTGWPI